MLLILTVIEFGLDSGKQQDPGVISCYHVWVSTA